MESRTHSANRGVQEGAVEISHREKTNYFQLENKETAEEI
jgi:hypothetical protein